MAAQKSHSQYVAELKAKRPTIRVLEKYVMGKIAILHKCRICKHEWNGIPNNILHSSGCPECAKKRVANKQRKSPEQYAADVFKIHGRRIVVVGDYVRDSLKLQHRCERCGHLWGVKPNNVLNGRGCPKCKATKAKTMRQTTDEYQKRLDEKYKGTVRLIGEFPGARRRKHFECLVCQNKWDTRGNSGCPKCSFIRTNSTRWFPKDYKLGKRTVLVQGYEDKALDLILSNTSIKPAQITVASDGKIPCIQYVFNGKTSNHYPDILIRKRDGSKLIVEVKSILTFGLLSWEYRARTYERNRAKAKAAIAAGYDYRFFIVDNGKRVCLPDDWMKYSAYKLAKLLGIKRKT